jgi:hypothetical protein
VGAFVFVVWKWSVRMDEESDAVAGQLTDMIRKAPPKPEAT